MSKTKSEEDNGLADAPSREGIQIFEDCWGSWKYWAFHQEPPQS